jgi:hypothetical protein
MTETNDAKLKNEYLQIIEVLKKKIKTVEEGINS